MHEKWAKFVVLDTDWQRFWFPACAGINLDCRYVKEKYNCKLHLGSGNFIELFEKLRMF